MFMPMRADTQQDLRSRFKRNCASYAQAQNTVSPKRTTQARPQALHGFPPCSRMA
jgi:hypothetical protein